MTDTDTLPAVEGRTDTYYLNGAIRTDLKDGIYPAMEDSVYFAQERLGSTDLTKLSTDHAEDYWHGSKMNPNREEPAKEDGYTTGKALHCVVLDGEAAFASRFVAIPETYPDAKTGESKPWNMNANFCKDWVENLPREVTPMKAKSIKDVENMGILIRKHPQLEPFFRGGLSEVAILFHYDGIPMRAKFDKLLVGYIADLKSAGKHKDAFRVPPGVSKDLMTSLQIMRNLKMDLQYHLYNTARGFMKAMVESGMVYDASPKQLEFLKKVVEQETWQWLYCFYRVPSNSTRAPAAPVVTPLLVEPNGFLAERGYNRLTRACENYKRLMAQFGSEIPWVRLNETQVVDDALLAQVYGTDGEFESVIEEDDSDE